MVARGTKRLGLHLTARKDLTYSAVRGILCAPACEGGTILAPPNHTNNRGGSIFPPPTSVRASPSLLSA